MHLAERSRRENDVRILGLAEQCRLDGEEPGLRARLFGRQVEGGPDEDVPEALDRPVGLAAGAQFVSEGLGVRRLAPAEKGPHDREPVTQRGVPVAQERRRRALDRGVPAALVDHR